MNLFPFLGTKQNAVLRSVVKYKTVPVAFVAEKSGMPRQTVLSILNQLADYGLVYKSKRASVLTFTTDHAVVKKSIGNYIKQLQCHISKIDVVLKKDKEKLTKVTRPKLLYFEGSHGLKQLLRHILDQYDDPLVEKVFRGYGINNFSKVLDNELYTFVRERFKKGVITKLFIADAPHDFFSIPQMEFGRIIKKLPIDIQQSAIYIVGDSVYVFSYATSSGFVMTDPMTAKIYRDVFDDHWKRVI